MAEELARNVVAGTGPRKRVEFLAQRFTLAEGQTLTLDLPFVQR